MAIFKIELYCHFYLDTKSTKATMGGEIMEMVFSGILRHILCLGMNMTSKSRLQQDLSSLQYHWIASYFSVNITGQEGSN